MEFSLKKVK